MRAIVLALVFLAACSSPETADTLYVNGRVWTGVLGDDLRSVAPSAISDIQVPRTVVGGRTVYRAGAQ